MNEADTCRKYVVPRLINAGWDEPPHSLTEQLVADIYKGTADYQDHGRNSESAGGEAVRYKIAEQV